MYNKEKRTGKSYATTKDKLRQRVADLEAERAVSLSKLKAAQAKELSAARQLLRETSASINQRHTIAVDSILALNQTHINTRNAAVAAYGGGLAWFTIVALIVFIASVILERIHRKGSGIEETVDLSQYDISPNAITEAWVALKNRAQFVIRSQIRAFAEKTPPAPLPVTPTELYDPTQLSNLRVELQLLDQDAEENNVIFIAPKATENRISKKSASKTPPPIENRRVEENQEVEETDPHIKTKEHTHEDSRAVKDTREKADYSMADLLQRLKDYKKRLGKHEQKKLALERAGKTVSKRTLNAITNNANWVKHYEALIAQAKEIKS